MSIYTDRNRKPPPVTSAGATLLNKGHWLGKQMSLCVPFLGPGTPREVVTGNRVQLLNAGFLGTPALNWQNPVNNSGVPAYPGSSADPIVASGWLDRSQNLLATAPVRTYTVTLGTTSANLIVFYGSGSGSFATISSFPITAAAFQTALTGLTTVGSGNATVTGSNNGPFTVTILTPAQWPGDLLCSGAANPGVQNYLPNAGMILPWSASQLSKFQTIPTGAWASDLIKIPSTVATQGTIRFGDTRNGAPACVYIGSLAGDVTFNWTNSSNVAQNANYPISAGGWYWFVRSYGPSTVDFWINGAHQTQKTSASLSDLWTNNVGTGATASQELAINVTMNGAGSTLQSRGTTTNQVNNAGIAHKIFAYNQQLVDADVQRWANEGMWSFLYPTRPIWALGAVMGGRNQFFFAAGGG